MKNEIIIFKLYVSLNCAISQEGKRLDSMDISGEKSVDMWRDTPLRYLGYANEVGESFRPIYPKCVVPSYLVAFSYVGCDTFAKTCLAYKRGDSNSEVAKQATDAFLWQTLASVLIPGKIIHGITLGCTKAVRSTAVTKMSLPLNVIKYSPTAIGLASIPLIIHPIDHFVDFAMDNSTRKWGWTKPSL